ncbi:MAG: hypothetical protein LEGION0398_MBIBDBAK_00105 [Legionellaceae bacterium]
MTYSIDFRRHVLTIKAEENLSFAETSLRFKIGKSSLVRWSTCLGPKIKRDKPATKINMALLKQDIQSYTDSYYHERAQRLGVSKTGIYWAIKCMGISYKKNATASQSRRRTAVINSTEFNE